MAKGLQILGGLLEGVGKGVTQQANDVRTRALRQMEIDAANARETQRQTFESGENAKKLTFEAGENDTNRATQIAINDANQMGADTRSENEIAGRKAIATTETGARRGLLASTFISDDGTLNTVDAGGKVTNTGKKVLPKDVAAKDKLFLEAAKVSATVTEQVPVDAGDPRGAQKTITHVDPERYSAALRKSKNPDIRALADDPTSSYDTFDQPAGADNTANPPGLGLGDAGSATVTPNQGPRGLTMPTAAAGDVDIDKKAKADAIRQAYKDKKLTKDQANQQLNDLYAN